MEILARQEEREIEDVSGIRPRVEVEIDVDVETDRKRSSNVLCVKHTRRRCNGMDKKG